MPANNLPSRIRDVIGQVAAEYRVSVDDLLGPNTARKFSRPRQEAMRRVRGLYWRGTGCDGHPSYQQIGRWFNRDHTTVIWAMRSTEATQLWTVMLFPLAEPEGERKIAA